MLDLLIDGAAGGYGIGARAIPLYARAGAARWLAAVVIAPRRNSIISQMKSQEAQLRNQSSSWAFYYEAANSILVFIADGVVLLLR